MSVATTNFPLRGKFVEVIDIKPLDPGLHCEVNETLTNVYKKPGDILDYGIAWEAKCIIAPAAGNSVVWVWNSWVDANPNTVSPAVYILEGGFGTGQPPVPLTIHTVGNREVGSPMPNSYGFQIEIYGDRAKEWWLEGVCGGFQKVAPAMWGN